MVRARKIGSTTDLTVLRDGATIRVTLELPAKPPEARELDSWEDETFEMTVRSISFMDRVDNRWPDDLAGVVVSASTSGGWAAFAGIYVGDLVTHVDGQAVASPDDMKRVMTEVEKTKPRRVVMRVRRGMHTSFVELEPAWDASRDTRR
jgi:S1-C subfamily serine protease